MVILLISVMRKLSSHRAQAYKRDPFRVMVLLEGK